MLEELRDLEEGLGKTISELIGGIAVEVDTNGFANDLVTFKNNDDVLTMLHTVLIN